MYQVLLPNKKQEKINPLEILQLTQKEGLQISKVKASFCKKIRAQSRNKNMRTKLSQSYVSLARQIFGHPSKQEEELIDAVIGAKVEYLKKMLRNNKAYIDFRSKGDNYPLIYHAVRSGHYDVVKLILEMGCNRKFAGDISTPMHCAAFYGHFTIIPLLLQYGIPIDIKNKFGNLPIQEACTDDIKKLLEKASKNGIIQISKRLNEQNLSEGIINIQHKDQIMIKKILLRDYYKFLGKQRSVQKKYVDAFHGTDYLNIFSICLHGLHPAGSIVDKKTLVPIEGHIRLEQNYRQQQNWAQAIFVSPSIFYSSLYIYSREMIVNSTEVWIPLIQVKAKKGQFQQHKHTLRTYKPRINEPQNVQYRIPENKKQDKEPSLMVVAVIFVRKQLLQNDPDYNQVTQLALNSNEERSQQKHRNKEKA